MKVSYAPLLLLCSILTIPVSSISRLQFPISRSAQGYYLTLIADGISYDCDFDFQHSSSYLVGDFPNNTNFTIKAGVDFIQLGVMQMQPFKDKSRDSQIKGRIGLASNSTFIKMLQAKFKHTVSVRFNLENLVFIIEAGGCKALSVEPINVRLSTWADVNMRTKVSFNFNPVEDFVALMNKTSNPFMLRQSQYSSTALHIRVGSEERQIYLKNVLPCWQYQGKTDRQCSIQTGTDIGLVLFQFGIKFCVSGVQLGPPAGPIDYRSYYIGGLLLNLGSIWAFKKRGNLIEKFAEETDSLWKKTKNIEIVSVSEV